MARSPTAKTIALQRELRADAADNRRRILEAARAVFAERGIDAPLDEIARQAGVGNATLYRRFPTRDLLVAAVFEARVAEYADAATEALRATNPWTGFCQFAQRVFAMQAADRGLSDVLTMTARPTERLEELRQRAYTDFAELVRRAQAAGELRADFVPEDFILLVLANQGVLRGTGDAARLASQRFLGLVLDGCRAAGAHALPAPPPAQRYAATQGLVRPEHRFPAPLDNRVTAYRWLLKQGFSAENIAGDSAGGNLTITTLMKLRDNGDPLPAAAAALSPVADLSDKDELFRDVRDPLLHPGAARIANRSYVAHGDARDAVCRRSWFMPEQTRFGATMPFVSSQGS